MPPRRLSVPPHWRKYEKKVNEVLVRGSVSRIVTALAIGTTIPIGTAAAIAADNTRFLKLRVLSALTIFILVSRFTHIPQLLL